MMFTSLRIFSAAALVALAIALVPAAARAAHEACGSETFGNDTMLPASGAIDVPRDTLFWIGNGLAIGGEMALVEVIGGVERRVPLTEEGRLLDVRGDVWILASPVVLRPNTMHRLYGCFGQDWCQTTLTEFTTGMDFGAEAPAAPTLTRSAFGSDKEDAFIEITLDQGGIVIADDPENTLDLDTLLGRVGVVLSAQDGEFALVESCNTWPLSKSGGQLRFGVFNLNGTFSGWSEPTTWEVPYYSCSLSGPSSAGLLVLPLLLCCRRRRPRR